MPRAEPEAKRINGNMPRVATKLRAGEPVGVVVLGDSVARGDEAVTPTRSFISLWADRLHETFGSRIQVTNMSQGGNTANDARRLLRITRTLDLYDLVVVSVGVNDATLTRRGKPQVSLRSFKRAIESVVREARKAGCDVLLISPIVPSRSFPTAEIDAYRVALEEIATAERCAFADVTRAWQSKAGEHWLANGLNHPNDAGHAVCAQTLIAATLDNS